MYPKEKQIKQYNGTADCYYVTIINWEDNKIYTPLGHSYSQMLKLVGKLLD